ncbi:leucine-rich repeat, cysteine-containing subtype protein [Tanacetum coccineum]|uniref:Leucine-rich repeat, cysteine-containing subtype protein n=1 Tax=Tanacetum coccineum TaxID=301880 RepID=A0ABQ5FCA7_9ASTR
MDHMCQCSLFKMCPNLEVIYFTDECGDKGLQVIAKFCKKLHKLTHYRPVTHVGLIALAKGCTKLECVKVRVEDISNEAIKCIGKHLKNLCNFRVHLAKKDGTTDVPLDNGIRALLMGCSKLEKLDITLERTQVDLRLRAQERQNDKIVPEVHDFGPKLFHNADSGFPDASSYHISRDTPLHMERWISRLCFHNLQKKTPNLIKVDSCSDKNVDHVYVFH